MKRDLRLGRLQVFAAVQPAYGIETAAIDNLTNLVAFADPALTHSEVFIAGTAPHSPIQDLPPVWLRGAGRVRDYARGK